MAKTDILELYNNGLISKQTYQEYQYKEHNKKGSKNALKYPYYYGKEKEQ